MQWEETRCCPNANLPPVDAPSADSYTVFHHVGDEISALSSQSFPRGGNHDSNSLRDGFGPGGTDRAGRLRWQKKVPGRPDTVSAKVTVTYKGSPVEGATVVLFAENPSDKPAGCVTGAGGTGTLMTFQPGDGAVPGSYVATVSKLEQITLTQEQQDAIRNGGQGPVAKDLLPAKYKDKATSGLKVTINATGSNDITLDLTD